MARDIGDVNTEMHLPRLSDSDLWVYLLDGSRGAFDVSSPADVRVAIASRPGGDVLIDRRIGDGTAEATTQDGLPVVRCDPVTDWSQILPGIYVGQVWLEDADGNWTSSQLFRVRVTDPVGGPV